MAIRVLWDEKETAVLVDYYMHFVRDEMSREQAIKEASAELRAMAVKNGVQIDDTYRNENGITMQMIKIEDIYTGRKRRLSKAPQVFFDVVNMYCKDYKAFKNLLREARGDMIINDEENVEEEYKEWLSGTAFLSPTQISKFYYVYQDIESYFQQCGILKKELFKTTDIAKIKEIVSAMESDRNFLNAIRMQLKKRRIKIKRKERREQEKEQIEKQKTAINYYYKFITERAASIESKEILPIGEAKELSLNSDCEKGIPLNETEKDETVNSVTEEERIKDSAQILAKDSQLNDGEQDRIIIESEGKTVFRDDLLQPEEDTKSLPAKEEEENSESAIDEEIKESDEDVASVETVVEEKEQGSIATNKDVVSESATSPISEETENPSDHTEGGLHLDFKSKTGYYWYTCPDKLVYFGKEYVVNTWGQLFVLIVSCLYKEYPDIILSVRDNIINAYITDEDGQVRIAVPQKIADNVYVETRMSGYLTVKRVKFLLDSCHVDYENIVIIYHSTTASRGSKFKKEKIADAEKQVNVEEPTASKEQVIPDARPVTEGQTIGSLVKYLKGRGIEFIDDREKNGNLWIVGGYTEHKELIDECSLKFGAKFRFKYWGKEIDGRNGWQLYSLEENSNTVENKAVLPKSGLPGNAENTIEKENIDFAESTEYAYTNGLAETELIKFEASSSKITSMDEFIVWILTEDKDKTSEEKARNISYDIKLCEIIAAQRGIFNAKLYNVQYKQAAETARSILQDQEINNRDFKNRSWMRFSLIKFLQYLAFGSNIENTQEQENVIGTSGDTVAIVSDQTSNRDENKDKSTDEAKENKVDIVGAEKINGMSAENVAVVSVINAEEQRSLLFIDDAIQSGNISLSSFSDNNEKVYTIDSSYSVLSDSAVSNKDEDGSCVGKNPKEEKVAGDNIENDLSASELFEFEASDTKIASSDAFMNWMLVIFDKKMDESSAQACATAIQLCGVIATQKGYSETKLYNVSYKQAAIVARKLLLDPEINGSKKTARSWLKDPLIKFLKYLSAGSDIKHTKEITGSPFQEKARNCSLNELTKTGGTFAISDLEQNDEFENVQSGELKVSPASSNNDKQAKEINTYEDVLKEHFSNGYLWNSNLYLKRFIKFYNEKYRTQKDVSDEETKQFVKNEIRSAGIWHDGYVYAADCLLDEQAKNQLLSFIENIFSSGTKVLYYSVLFEKFNDVFLGQKIYDEGMLRAYLMHEYGQKYFFETKYMTSELDVQSDPKTEIKNLLLSHGSPMRTDDIYKALPNLPNTKIYSILCANKEFISNARGEYFHIRLIDLNKDELDRVAGVIQDGIRTHNFMSGNEMLNSVTKKYPDIFERFSDYSEIGLRDAIAYYLGDRFSFTGNIISEKDRQITMGEVFAEFAKSHDSFTIEELNVLKTEIGTAIYYDPIYEYSMRISQEQFVSKAKANFDVQKTDEAISVISGKPYMSLSDVKSFSVFPYAGFPWNTFLLESYVASFSAHYKLLHKGYRSETCAGGIVEKNAGIDTFDDLIVMVLADSGITLNRDSALSYLREHGYLVRKKYTGIEMLINRAISRRG